MNNYYIDNSVLVENRPLVKFIRNYIRALSGVFSISSPVRISMTSFPALTLLFVQKYSCPYNKKKITRWLEDMNFIISSLRCNIHCLYNGQSETRVLIGLGELMKCRRTNVVTSCKALWAQIVSTSINQF